jgi:hypothetical protein
MIIFNMPVHPIRICAAPRQFIHTSWIKALVMVHPRSMILRLIARLKTQPMLHTHIPTIWNPRIPLCSPAAPVFISLANLARPVEVPSVLVEMGLIAEGLVACETVDSIGVRVDGFFDSAVGVSCARRAIDFDPEIGRGGEAVEGVCDEAGGVGWVVARCDTGVWRHGG